MTITPVECRGVWKIFGDKALEALAAIRSEGLSKDEVFKRYDCIVGVADVSFSVQLGEIFCIMGLSGSGKSTLVRHINRLIEPTAGEIFIEGENVNHKSQLQLRELRAGTIGMVFQNMALMPHRNARDNVSLGLEFRGMGKRQRQEVAEATLALVKLEGWGDRYPDELSGGMQQRVGLARAIAADPDILLMDEPFSALDPLIRRQLQDQFLDLARNMKKTTIFITHDLDEAIRLGNHIAIMKDGRLVQIGTPEEIVTAPADDYVADFVQGISRLHLIHADRIMTPIADYAANATPLPPSAPTAPLDADLDIMISLSNTNDNQTIVIVDDQGTRVGVVTTAMLLRAVQGVEN